jgi:hypothetical protein
MKTRDRRYPQCRCVRFGQSRLEPLKRTALDGKVWWVVFDHFKGEYYWSRFPKRRQALAHPGIDGLWRNAFLCGKFLGAILAQVGLGVGSLRTARDDAE